jgi:hypothetical protein
MPYQTGTVDQTYNQDNSGTQYDIATNVSYTPQQFGAPKEAKIIEGTVLISPHVLHGNAWISDRNVTGDTVQFVAHTEAAGGFPFGHHSSAIQVHTTFTWYTD